MSDDKRKLTPKQARFIQEYLIDCNATGAARRAGYSEKAAEQVGFDNLRKPWIAEVIQKEQAKLAKKLNVTVEKIISEYAKIAFANTLDYVRVNDDGLPEVDFGATTKDQFAAVAEVNTETVFEGRDEDRQIIRKTKFKLHDKKGALDSLARHLGMFTDKVDVTSGGKPLETAVNIYLPDNGRDSQTAEGTAGTVPEQSG